MDQMATGNGKGGCVLFEVADGALLGPNRAEILRRIAGGSSVETAATFTGITGDHAMYLITYMNESSAQPLVELDGDANKVAHLTRAGATALADYDKAVYEWRLSKLTSLRSVGARFSVCS